MHIGVAIPCNGVKVIGCRVAFVAVEPVPGIANVEVAHLPIAGDLGDDRRGRDG